MYYSKHNHHERFIITEEGTMRQQSQKLDQRIRAFLDKKYAKFPGLTNFKKEETQ